MAQPRITDLLRTRLGEAVRIEPAGFERYQLLMPFSFDDGDRFQIVLRKEGDRWVLADEGTTYMHLTYDMDEKDFTGPSSRQRIIANTLSTYAIEDRDGELVLPASEERLGDALFDYVQALTRISDVTFLSRERVRTTFLQDLRSLIVTKVPQPRRAMEWHDEKRDPLSNYPVDYRIEAGAKPIFVFALTNDDNVQVATISLHQFERWGLANRSLGIFEDQEQISRKVLARFSDVAGKQISALPGNEDRIVQYLNEAVG